MLPKFKRTEAVVEAGEDPGYQSVPIDWMEFKELGLLWFVNRMLMVFGYAIIIAEDEENKDMLYVTAVRTESHGYSIEADDVGMARFREFLHEIDFGKLDGPTIL